VGRNRRGEEAALTIRQPDGTLAHLPMWMTQDRAAAMSVTEFPRLRWRVFVNFVSSSMPVYPRFATSPVATSMHRPQSRHHHPDLFALKEPQIPIAAADRTKLLPLISALLIEVLAVITAAMKITPEHQSRGAFIYIRQSTADQLANNHESRRRQYGLADVRSAGPM
jgi:hypothetical protein